MASKMTSKCHRNTAQIQRSLKAHKMMYYVALVTMDGHILQNPSKFRKEQGPLGALQRDAVQLPTN